MYSFVLPGGYIDSEHVVHTEVVLSPLNGHDEELLAKSTGMNSASLVTKILASCINKLGEINNVTEEIVRELTVGDRQYLMLRLREVTFGDRVDATVFCPWPDCGERVDINFRTGNVPVKAGSWSGKAHEMSLTAEAVVETKWEHNRDSIRFRVPNGEDQETLSPMLNQNEAEALSRLFERCIYSLGDCNEPDLDMIRALSPLARMEIEKEMELVSPGIDLNIQTKCPECGRKFTVPFDLQEFFFGEFRISKEHLYREVHYLAYHYHWSEQEIMEFSREKRRQYIEVLAEEIERLNNAIA